MEVPGFCETSLTDIPTLCHSVKGEWITGWKNKPFLLS
jgi:hypothetical protein